MLILGCISILKDLYKIAEAITRALESWNIIFFCVYPLLFEIFLLQKIFYSDLWIKKKKLFPKILK